jgi:hypothetical protein
MNLPNRSRALPEHDPENRKGHAQPKERDDDTLIKFIAIQGINLSRTMRPAKYHVADPHEPPNFSLSNGHNRSGLNGVAVKRMPVASASALPSAAATGL